MHLHHIAIDRVLSTGDANRVGYDAAALLRLCRSGRLLRLIRGWYAVWPPDEPVPPWHGDTPWERASNRHLLLVTALVRSFQGRVAASHQSALVLADTALYGLDLSTAHVSRVVANNTRHRAHCVIHPVPPQVLASVQTVRGLPTVAPAVAVVQVGLVAQGDRRPDPVPGLVAAEALLRQGRITHEDIEEALALFAGHPNISAAREALSQASAEHESAGETRLSWALRCLGYRVRAQVTHLSGQARVDFQLAGEPVIIEFDGLGKYAEGQDATPEAVRRALAREKEREDDLRAQGFFVVRITWSDLDHPARIREKVERARELARQFRVPA